jgi:hypothetical protein
MDKTFVLFSWTLPLIFLEHFTLIAYRQLYLVKIIEYRFSPELTTFATNVITSPSRPIP